MSDDENKVTVPAEETPEDPETPEPENPEEPETPEPELEEPEEDPEQIRKDAKAFKDQKKRAEKAEADAKALRDKYEPKTRKDGQDLSALEQQVAALQTQVVRANLSAAGVKHPDDQKFVIEAAKRLGVDPVEAATDELVAAKLERMRASRATKEATPAPNKRGTSSGTSDVARLADKVEKGGALPSDPALAEKVQQEIARRAQERA